MKIRSVDDGQRIIDAESFAVVDVVDADSVFILGRVHQLETERVRQFDIEDVIDKVVDQRFFARTGRAHQKDCEMQVSHQFVNFSI